MDGEWHRLQDGIPIGNRAKIASLSQWQNLHHQPHQLTQRWQEESDARSLIAFLKKKTTKFLADSYPGF